MVYTRVYTHLHPPQRYIVRRSEDNGPTDCRSLTVELCIIEATHLLKISIFAQNPLWRAADSLNICLSNKVLSIASKRTDSGQAACLLA